MARIKLGAFITEISGSLGGQSIQKNRSGISLKTKVNNVDQATHAQLEQRSIMLAVQNAWRSLSDEQRKAWHFSIDFFKAISFKDSSVQLSGRELFIRWNILLLTAGFSIVQNPDFESSYEIDSDFSLYADDFSFFAVFDSDPTVSNKAFLLNMSRSAPYYYSPARSSVKRIDFIDMGAGGFNLQESFLSQHAVLPKVNDNISGALRQFSKVAPISSVPKRFLKPIFPTSFLLPGSNWSNIGNPVTSTVFYSFLYISNTELYCIGSNPIRILKSNNLGLTWSNIASISGVTYAQCITNVSDSIFLIGGRVNGSIIRTTDKGLTWTNIGQQYGQSAIFSIFTTTSGNILAGSSPNGYILRSTDNGLTFSNIGSFFGSTRINSFVQLESGRIFAASGPSGLLLYSDDDGLTWLSMGSIAPGFSINTLKYFGNGFLIAGLTLEGGFAISLDYGVTWSVTNPSFTHGSILDIMCINDSYLLASSLTGGLLLRSFDKGFTWESLGNFFSYSYISQLVYIGNGTLLGCTGVPAYIIRSSLFPNA